MTDRADIVFKVLIIGESMVGKSSLLFRFADDQFPDLQPTIGVDCRPSYLEVRGRWIKLKIWDTAGQEKYRSITKSFYHGAHGALVVYDVTKRQTFEDVPKWIKEMSEIIGDVPYILVGNKCDVQASEVSQTEAENLANELCCMNYMASALSGENVKQAFTSLCELMMDTTKCYEMPAGKLKMKTHEEKTCCC